MSGPPLVEASPELMEREHESAVLDALVDRLREGGGALLVRGEAGIGRSVVLQRAVTPRVLPGRLIELTEEALRHTSEVVARFRRGRAAILLHVGTRTRPLHRRGRLMRSSSVQ